MDSERFSHIAEAYASFERELLRSGKLPLRATSRGFWSAAIGKEVFSAFQELGLKNYKKFIDLGSGDGRVVLIASLFVPKAEGIEIDEELHGIAQNMGKKLGSHATFHCKDLYAHDLSPYDVFFISPDAPFERGMEGKLLKEMKGDLIVYGNHFHPRFMEKKKSITVNGTLVGVYGRK